MPDLVLVGGQNPLKSKTKLLAVSLEHAVNDITAAHNNLPIDMQLSLKPHIEDVLKRLNGLIEMALIAGYRKGLVDFFEDDPSNSTT